MAGQTVTIGPRAGGGYALVSRYDARLIEIAKECGGRWNPGERCWTFATLAAAKLLATKLMDAGFLVVHDFTEPPPAQDTKAVESLRADLAKVERENQRLRRELTAERRRSTAAQGLEVEALLREFGLPMYRALTRVVHPDAGGTHDAMVKINRLWDRIGRST